MYEIDYADASIDAGTLQPNLSRKKIDFFIYELIETSIKSVSFTGFFLC